MATYQLTPCDIFLRQLATIHSVPLQTIHAIDYHFDRYIGATSPGDIPINDFIDDFIDSHIFHFSLTPMRLHAIVTDLIIQLTIDRLTGGAESIHHNN